MSKVVKAITGAVSGVAKAVGSVIGGVVSAVGSVVSSVLNFVMSPFLGLFGMNMPTADTTPQSISGVTVQRTGTAVNIPVVYGYRQVAGAVTFAETGADNNKYLWVAYVFSEGPVEGLHDLFIDDVQIPAANLAVLNTGHYTDITDTSCKFAGALRLQWSNGYFTQNPADTNVGYAVGVNIFAGAPSWMQSMNYNGMAALFARYEWKTTISGNTQSAIYSGSIPVVKANLMGRRVTSLVSGSAENYTYNDYSHGYTERYSTNPAEILLDYLRNPWYGKGLTNDRIDFDSFRRAAAKCNTEIAYTTSGIKGPILTLNYVTDTGQTIFTNVKDMLANFRAYLPYVNGKLSLVIEDAGNPTDILSGSAPIAATFTKDNIQGDITYTGVELTSKYNVVTVNYCDPDQQWTAQTVVYPPTEDERNRYRVIDGYRENKGDFTFKGITNYAIAYDLARLIFNKSREQDTLNLTVSSQAFELQPGDSIYVDANILQFGTDPNAGAIPWRIISTKLNNDYTFTLGCVRNPVDIYPYVRITDKAYNLSLFVPQGATRYYPPEPPGIPVGLNPPSNATLPAGQTVVSGGPGTDYPVTLGPTTPTGSAGGGVGSSTGTVNSGNNPNTAPTPAAGAAPLNEVMTVKSVSYSLIGGVIYADVTMIQPLNAAYSGVTIYWKRQIANETVWQNFTDTTRPGAGSTITVRIGPMITQPYMIQTRVHYGSQGDSTVVGYETINPVSSGTEIPTNYSQQVTSGWNLNTTPIPNTADVQVGSITAMTVLTSSHPSTPRALNFSVIQYSGPTGQNAWVNGLTVYYRASTATYWNYKTIAAPATYVGGVTPITFTLDSLGVPSYPNTPTAQLYDFVIRYNYMDGRATKKQYRAMSVKIEQNAVASYNFDAFAGIIAANEDVSAYTVTTVDQAPPGSVALPADITISLSSVETRNQIPYAVRFFFQPPAVSNQPDWYGVRVYYRQVLDGANPTYQTLDFTPATRSTTGEWSVMMAGIAYDQEYQWVIVPLVTSSTGMATATNCWMGQGSVNIRYTASDYPGDNNFMSLLKFSTMKTADAIASISTAFSSVNPVARVLSWRRVYTTTDTTQPNYRSYYQLQVQVPTINFNELRIYRRENTGYIGNNYTYGFGRGRWEIMVITDGFNNNGVQTFNLRGPVSANEFDSYYNISASSPFYSVRTNTLILPQFADTAQLKPISTGSYDEFLLVLKTNGSVSTQALMLPKIAQAALTLSVDGLSTQAPVRVAVADYNTYTAGYQRNLTDARTPVNTSWLTDSNRPNINIPNTTPGII